MPHKTKLPPEEKLRLVQLCLSGQLSANKAAAQAGVSQTTMRGWIRLYNAEGAQGLYPRKTRTGITAEQKLAAVQAYLAGEGSLFEICEKYKIRNTQNLEKWAESYRQSKALPPAHGTHGFVPQRYTTAAQRQMIVQECLQNGCNYRQTAEKYGISYRALVNWVQAYRQDGKTNLRSAYHAANGADKAPYASRPVPSLERLYIILYALEHECDYLSTAQKHGVSYRQVAVWVAKYRHDGFLAARARRGPTPAAVQQRQLALYRQLNALQTDDEIETFLAALPGLTPPLREAMERAGYTPAIAARAYIELL